MSIKSNFTTKCLLLKEATEQFSINGFTKSSIRSICKKVNVSVASVNYHFGNKDMLVNEVVSCAILSLIAATKEAEDSSPKNLKTFFKNYALLVNDLQNEVILVFREVFRNDSKSILLDNNVNEIQQILLQRAKRIKEKDPHVKDLNDLEERVNIFNSLIAIEIVRNSLSPTPNSNTYSSKWLESNISRIFE